MLCKQKSCGKRYVFMLYRWIMAENGGSWLKMAKTVSLEYQFLIFFNACYIICLCGSVVVFCSWNLKVMSSIPVKANFFFLLCLWVQTPLWFFMIFSCVELNFLCHLWLLDIINDINQTKIAPVKLSLISSSCWPVW